jgi:hypothetical protein
MRHHQLEMRGLTNAVVARPPLAAEIKPAATPLPTALPLAPAAALKKPNLVADGDS